MTATQSPTEPVDAASPVQCRICEGKRIAALHMTYSTFRHWYCLECKAHLYGQGKGLLWYTKKEWDEWMEARP